MTKTTALLLAGALHLAAASCPTGNSTTKVVINGTVDDTTKEILRDYVFPTMDTDQSGGATALEFEGYAKKIGLCPADILATDEYYTCCEENFDMPINFTAIGLMAVQGIDGVCFGGNGDGEISFEEIEGLADKMGRRSRQRRLQSTNEEDCVMEMIAAKIQASLMPSVDTMGDELGAIADVHPDILAGTWTVKFSFTFTTFSTPTSGDTKAVTQQFAQEFDVDAGSITTSIESLGSRRLSVGHRKLEVKTYKVTSKIFFADEEAAAVATDADEQALADTMAAELQPLGLTVDTASFEAESEPIPGTSPMPMGQFASIAMILGFTGLSCGLASMVSSMKSKGKGAEKGCCSDGCCSYFAIKGWSGSELLSAIVLLIASFLLFNAMGAFATAVKGILEGFIGILALQLAEVQSMTGSFTSYQSILGQVEAQIDLLPIAAIVPGALAAVMLIISSICGFAVSGESYCCAKFPIFLSYIFLLVCMILYFVLTAVSVVMYLPMAQDALRQATSMCDNAVPMLKNTKMQVLEAVAMADDVGGQFADLLDADTRAKVGQLDLAVTAFDTICTAFSTDLILAIEGLLSPAIFGLVATMWAYFNSFGLCCAEGCCKSPVPATVKPAA